MTDGFVVRPVRPAETDAVRALHRVDAGDGDVPADDLDRIAESYAVFLVGTLDDRVVATGGLATEGWIHDLLADDDRTAVVRRLRVAADLRGRGYGSRVLAALEGRARDRDRPTLVLDTGVHRTAAQRFYVESGYRPHRLLVAGVRGDPHPVLVYRKRLDG